MTKPSPILQSLGSGVLFYGAIAAALACSPIAPTDNGDAGVPWDAQVAPEGGGLRWEHVVFTPTSERAGHVHVDASDAEHWVYVDLDARAEVTPLDPQDDDTWDLAFRRFHIAVNGGVTGSGGVSVARVDGQPFDAVALPAEGAFGADEPDGDDDDALPDYAISGGVDPWYDYDVVTHVLTPKARVYVVRTSVGAAVKVAIESYYDGAGGSGHPRLRYAGFEE